MKKEELHKILDSLVLECAKKNANYKKIIAMAFSLGCDFKTEELMEKISNIFKNERK